MAHVVSAAAGAAATSVTTGAVDTTGANTLLAIVSSDNSTTSAVTDSYGNTWLPLSGSPIANTIQTWGYYAAGAKTGPGHTFTATITGGTTNHTTLAVSAFSGRDPISPIGGAQATFSTGTFVQSQVGGTVTAGANGDLWEGACDPGNQATETFTAGAGWTIGASALSPGSNYQPEMVQYKNAVAAGSVSGPYSTTNYVVTAGFIVSLRAASTTVVAWLT